MQAIVMKERQYLVASQPASPGGGGHARTTSARTVVAAYLNLQIARRYYNALAVDQSVKIDPFSCRPILGLF
jgi:hypothetical protein